MRSEAIKKLINDPEDVVPEQLEGLALAYPHLIKVNLEPKYVYRADAPVEGEVALVSGGGSGHEPLHGGYVGHGMLDAAWPGEVFTSPTPDQVLEAAKVIDGGTSVLHLIKNYSDDVMNFQMAADMARDENINVDSVIIDDKAYTRTLPRWDAEKEEWVDVEVTDPPFEEGDRVLAFVNSMGGTPAMELLIVYRKLHEICEDRGLEIVRTLMGRYITSLEMQGASITLLRLDEEMIELWDAPVKTQGLRWGR